MIASKNPVITGCKSIFLHSNGRAALFLPRARAKGRFRISPFHLAGGVDLELVIGWGCGRDSRHR